MDHQHQIDEKTSHQMWQHIYAQTFSKRKRRIKIYKRLASVACIVFVFIGIHYVLSLENQEPIFHCKNTMNHEVYFLLPDSSEVKLMPNSSLEFTVNRTSNERIASITGKAIFNVHKNPLQAFIVKIKSIEIKALGTIFSVDDTKNEQVEIKLIEGKIAVSNSNQKNIFSPQHIQTKTLIAGQICQLNPDKPLQEFKVEQHSYSNLVSKKQFTQPDFNAKYVEHQYVEFKNEKLTNALRVLGMIYHKEFVFNVKDSSQYYFTGTIERDDSLKLFVANIAKINHLKISQTAHQIVFY